MITNKATPINTHLFLANQLGGFGFGILIGFNKSVDFSTETIGSIVVDLGSAIGTG